MKLLYITDALAIYGGLERILVEKVNLLKKIYGYEIYLITLNQGDHPVLYSLDPNVKYSDLGILFHKQYDFGGIKRILEINRLHLLFRRRLQVKIAEIEPDVIICARIDLLKTIDKVKGDIPLVFESHTYRRTTEMEGATFFTHMKSWMYRRYEKLPQMIVTLTDGDAQDWKTRNPNICVIPNVVNLNNSGSYSDCVSKSVIFVGRFSKQKDIRSLLSIWKIVHKAHPDWSLHIYGGYGSEQDQLLPEIKRMDANITVYDPIPNILDKYHENSILLLTSIYEPFGLVLPEAMSCGLPVVAFDCPYGPADIITDGVDGFLIKERDVNLFAEKVSLLMDDVNLRRTMGQAGIISAQRYTAERIMPEWKQLFDQMIDKQIS